MTPLLALIITIVLSVLPTTHGATYDDSIPFFLKFGSLPANDAGVSVFEDPSSGDLFAIGAGEGKYGSMPVDMGDTGYNVFILKLDSNGHLKQAKIFEIPAAQSYAGAALNSAKNELIFLLHTRITNGPLTRLSLSMDLEINWVRQFRDDKRSFYDTRLALLNENANGDFFIMIENYQRDYSGREGPYSFEFARVSGIDGAMQWQKQAQNGYRHPGMPALTTFVEDGSGRVDLVAMYTDAGDDYLVRLDGDTGDTVLAMKYAYVWSGQAYSTHYLAYAHVMGPDRLIVFGYFGTGYVLNPLTGEFISGFEIKHADHVDKGAVQWFGVQAVEQVPGRPTEFIAAFLMVHRQDGYKTMIARVNANAVQGIPKITDLVEFKHPEPVQRPGYGGVSIFGLTILESSDFLVNPPVIDLAISGQGVWDPEKHKRDDAVWIKLIDAFNLESYSGNRGVDKHVLGCPLTWKKTDTGIGSIVVSAYAPTDVEDVSVSEPIISHKYRYNDDVEESVASACVPLSTRDMELRTCDCPLPCGDDSMNGGACSAKGVVVDPYLCGEIECQSMDFAQCGDNGKCVSLCKDYQESVSGNGDWFDCREVCGQVGAQIKCWHGCAPANGCRYPACSKRACRGNPSGTCSGATVGIDPFKCAENACVEVACDECGSNRQCIATCTRMNGEKGMDVDCKSECGAISGRFKCIATC